MATALVDRLPHHLPHLQHLRQQAQDVRTPRSAAGRTPGPGRGQTTVRSDGLACFWGGQAAGCAHQAQVTGGGTSSCETPRLSWVNTLLGNVKRAIDGTYHAGEACYAGRHLAAFAYHFNRRYQLADLVPRLVLRCCAHPAPARPAPNCDWNRWAIRFLIPFYPHPSPADRLRVRSACLLDRPGGGSRHTALRWPGAARGCA